MYKGDFFLRGLEGSARERRVESVDAFRDVVEDPTHCRRAMLLRHFGEVPDFGNRCGSCDNCTARAAGVGAGAVAWRDFSAEALCIVRAVASFGYSAPSKSKLMPMIQSEWARMSASAPPAAGRGIPRTQEVFETLLLSLCQQCGLMAKRKIVSTASLVDPATGPFLERGTASANVAGSKRTWETWKLTMAGAQLARQTATAATVMLPPPPSLLQLEQVARDKVTLRLKELSEEGVDLASVPAEERQTGTGPVINSLLQWSQRLRFLRSRDKAGGSAAGGSKADALQELLRRVLGWRDNVAEQLDMAPATVLPDHLAKRICYVMPRTSGALWLRLVSDHVQQW